MTSANLDLSIESLKIQQFALALSMRGATLAWFVGAGTSAAAGIPTGYDMILDFKTRLFCQSSQIPRSEIDPGDPLWKDRILAYLNGVPELTSGRHPNEYSIAFETVYPDPADRRTYIDQAVRAGSPSFGHRVLASLLSSRQIPVIFTTNFDTLIEDSTVRTDSLLPVNERVHLAVAAIDSAERAERCLRESTWPLLVKLHGDFQSEQLKNVGDELREQDVRLRRVLIGSCQRFGMVICGYSGRDDSVMAALEEAIKTEGSFPGGLYWITGQVSALLPRVTELLNLASTSGIETHIIEAENFDEIAGAIEMQTTFPAALSQHIREARPTARVHPVSIPTVEVGRFPALRATAMPLLSIPTVARRITLTKSATTKELQMLLRSSGFRKAIVASQGYEVAAFGSDSDLMTGLASLGPKLEGEIVLAPATDSWALGLLYEALTRALARRQPLRPQRLRHGHSLVIVPPNVTGNSDLAHRDQERLTKIRAAYGAALTGTVPGTGMAFAEGADIRLEAWFNRWWCVFDPYTWVDIPRSEGFPADQRPHELSSLVSVAGDWRRERWANRYNKDWAKIIEAWSKLIAPDRETTVHAFGLGESPGLDAVFSVSQVTAWSLPGSGIQVSENSKS